MSPKPLERNAVLVVVSKPPLIAYLLTSTPFTESRLRSLSVEVA
jgi:hypothetical protein